jgi:hypothetical protein
LKIVPANQTLILASESAALVPSSGPVANGAAFKRVTIFEARSATTVVVQADYYPQDMEPRAHAMMLPVQCSRPAPTSSYLNGVQLYARTQRGLDDAPKATLDVLA